ncbi:MAG: hypothetical protein KF788_09250 [Piscinibacter sp.]|nr:hypothetical protein [Piscinibacter sp.]
MPSTSLPPALRADKALVRQIADFDDRAENVEDFVELISAASVQAALRKDVALLRKRLQEALKDGNADAVRKTVAGLVKDAERLADKASDAHGRDLADRAAVHLNKARALMAKAMVEVGRIEPPALRLPLQKEQAALRKALDTVEAEKGASPSSIDTLQKMVPGIEQFIRRLEPVRKAGDWMRTGYLPQVARVEAAIKRVPAERCRKTLMAELDFIEADTNKALARADVGAVQSRALPTLQRIERLAARIVAASPGIDRELARLARLAGSGADAALAKRLKVMIQAKATTWPSGAEAADIDVALTRFEADLGKLGAEIDKASRKAPAKA